MTDQHEPSETDLILRLGGFSHFVSREMMDWCVDNLGYNPTDGARHCLGDSYSELLGLEGRWCKPSLKWALPEDEVLCRLAGHTCWIFA